MSLAPRTHVEVIYSGTNITKFIEADLISFTYTDNDGGKSDDVSIKLKNDHGRWSNEWFPIKGDTITTAILIETDDGVRRLSCGVCSIDEIKLSGPTSELEINAVSVPINTNIRRLKKSRAWENVRLSEIAADVAENGGLDLLYLTDIDPQFDRRDQREETDLQFLQRQCDDLDFKLKVTDSQLVVYNPEELEKEPAVATIERFEENVISYDFTTQAHDLVKTVVVEYSDPKTGNYNQFVYDVPGIERGSRHKITQRTESIAEAERLAKATARKMNSKEVTGSLSLIGDIKYLSGVNIELVNFGVFDGIYSVIKTEHNVGSGHVVTLELSKVVIS